MHDANPRRGGRRPGAAAGPLGALLAATLLAAGCTSGAPDPNGSAVAAQLRACGLLTPGYLAQLPLYAPDACYDGCLGRASCAELTAALCGTSVDALIRCDQQCALRCDDGSLLPVEERCNGFAACDGGEDEAGCPPPTEPARCPGALRCDGWVQCPDGRDEMGCDGFTCGDGEVVRLSSRCDGWPQCDDGSDEDDCAELALACPG